MTSSTILVAGAISVDSLVYSMPPSHQESDDHDSGMVIRKGGADLVAQLLHTAAPEWGVKVLGPSMQANGVSHANEETSRLAELSSHWPLTSSQPSYQLVGVKHFARAGDWHSPVLDHSPQEGATILVLVGSGESSDNVDPALRLLEQIKPSKIVHYMTKPLASGKLWDAIRGGADPARGIPSLDNVFVVVEAEDLRSQGINLSQGLSWEATSEDFVRNLGSNGRLDTLVTCPNLLVRFGTEGVIYHKGRDAIDPRLFFDSKHTEGTSQLQTSRMLGTSSAFTAGLTLGLTQQSDQSTEQGILLGMEAAREFAKQGFVADNAGLAPKYPDLSISKASDSHRKNTTTASIPSSRISTGERWLLLDTLTGDPTEVARQILTTGPEKALSRCPTRHYGDLITTERTEIESIGAICGIVEERSRNAQFVPTCVGIFGPAGSGKSFMASSIAKHLACATNTTVTIHDSRFLKEDSLAAVCHNIRDASATGSLPIVCFKNFEAVMSSDDDLLDTFSTLMSEGTFPDRGVVRNLGHAVMFFLINQDSSEAETAFAAPFSPSTAEMTLKRRSTLQSLSEMKQLKLEDSPLMDLLHGVIRVAGPNCTSGSDRTFAIRRALMLRHIIKQKYPHLEVNGVINIDDAVLHALLLTPTFKHGLDSLQKIITASRLSNRTKFDVSALPPEEQIQLHVDGRIFMSFLRSPKLPPALREILAKGLFMAYKKQRLLMVKDEQERRALEKERSFRDWDELPGELKESTRSQADDIPRKLRAIGCFMLNDGQAEPRGDPLVPMPRFNDKDLLMLSEMEHERFNAERLQRQWRMGPRNAKDRTTPFLIPWRDLTQEWKDVDTVMVECVPSILENAGWRIYKMKD